jgi:ABC-type glycerol-3-phosphate transport system substrate-binding protein
MNKSFRRTLSVFVVLSILILAAACGSTNTPAENTPAPTTQSAAAETQTVAETTKDVQPVTVRLLINEAEIKTFQDAVKPFTDVNPNIKLDYATMPFDQVKTKAIAAAISGDPYELIQVNHVDTLSYIKANVIQALDEYAKKDNIDFSKIVFPSLLSACSYQGKLFAIPYNTDTRVLAINKDLFAKYGVNPPATQEEMLAAGKKMTADGNYGFVNAFTRNPYVAEYEQGVFLLGNGGQLYKMDETGKAIATIDTPEMKAYLKFNLDLLEIAPKDVLTMKEDDGRKFFGSGKAGMYIWGPWEFDLSKDASVNYELIPIPAGSVKSGSTSGGFQYALGKGSKGIDAAWELLKFITTTPEALAKIAALGLPASEEAYKFAPFTDKKYDVFKEQLKTSQIPVTPVSNYGDVVSKFDEYWQKVLFKKMSIDDACKEAQSEVQKVLDKNN